MTLKDIPPTPLAFGHLNTFDQTSKKLNTSSRTIRRLVDRGELKAIRITECAPRITDLEIDRFIAAKASAR